MGIDLHIVIVFGFALCGGWISRMCGGAPPKLPWGLEQSIYALPYMVAALPATVTFGAWAFSRTRERESFKSAIILPYLCAFIAKRTGHGGGIDLGTSTVPRKDEKLEVLTRPLRGKLSEYWYDALFLSVTGLAVTLLAGVCIAVVAPLSGLLILVSGLLKGPAYMAGWAVYPKGHGKGLPHLNEATAIGEFLTGFFGWAAIGHAILEGFWS